MPRRFEFAVLIVLVLAHQASAATVRCTPDSVMVGGVCADRYEASAWLIPSSARSLIAKVRQGKAILAELNAAGATQMGPATMGTLDPCSGTEYGAGFPATGNWTTPVYAVSIPGVLPSVCLTWFQAEQACRLVGKRLLTNEEWKAIAAGTPDPGTDDGMSDCNTSTSSQPVKTGSRSKCVSLWGAFDMVGNVWEWTATWLPRATQCPGWPNGFTDDQMCVTGGDNFGTGPGAVLRGGSVGAGGGAFNGVFAISSFNCPSDRAANIGFRCGK